MLDTGVRNAAKTIRFPLVEADTSDFASVTFEAGDVLVIKDGGTPANIGTLPTEIGSTGYYEATLTATEMDAESIVVLIVDQTGTKVWKDQSVRLETYGSATAEHQFIPVGAAITYSGPFYRQEVDVDGRTRISVRIADGFGAVPTAAEITAGAISIYRRARGATTFETPPLVDAVTMQKADGEVWYDFNSTDAAVNAGDELYFDIQGVKVTRNGVDYEMDSGATGVQYHLAVQGRPVESLASSVLAAINAEVDTALADYDPPTKAELDTAQGVITSAISALNNLSAAQVNAEVDTALADYDAPTKAELDAGFAALNDLSAAEVNAEVDTALADYDAPTNAELTTAQGVITSAISALNNLDSATIVAAVLAGIVEGTYTLRDVLRLLFAADCGQLTGPAPGSSGTVSIKSPVTPATTRISAPVDANGQRTATTLTPA